MGVPSYREKDFSQIYLFFIVLWTLCYCGPESNSCTFTHSYTIHTPHAILFSLSHIHTHIFLKHVDVSRESRSQGEGLVEAAGKGDSF